MKNWHHIGECGDVCADCQLHPEWVCGQDCSGCCSEGEGAGRPPERGLIGMSDCGHPNHGGHDHDCRPFLPQNGHQPDVRDDMYFDDGLSALIALAMRVGDLDHPTARAIIHALHGAEYLK